MYSEYLVSKTVTVVRKYSHNYYHNFFFTYETVTLPFLEILIFCNRVNGEVDDSIDTISAGVVTAVRIPLRLSNIGSESAVAPTISFDLPQGTGFIRAFEVTSVSIQQNFAFVHIAILITLHYKIVYNKCS